MTTSSNLAPVPEGAVVPRSDEAATAPDRLNLWVSSQITERARKIAAAICEADGCDDGYCDYMREGAYDKGREVRIAEAALLTRLAPASFEVPA